jgi:hypothetical protein
MKSYSKIRDEIAKSKDEDEKPKIRTDYRCKAHGCPNTGCIDDTGPGTGRCYWHWREEDPRKWPAITQEIHENFYRAKNPMRNWDPK